MSESYEAATEVCGALEQIRQELDYIGRQLDNSNLQDRRERIATAVLCGLAANGCDRNKDTAVEVAVQYADALIVRLNQPATEEKPK